MRWLRIELWDFCSPEGENLLLRWAHSERLSKRDRAVLDQKLERLTQIDFNLAITTSLLRGPIGKHNGIYKLRAMGEKALRPLLCRGPMSISGEYTLLQGSVERDRRMDPADAPERAASHLNNVVRDPSRRRGHESFSTKSD